MESTLNDILTFNQNLLSPGESNSPIKIWLVDDNKNLRSTLRDLLNRFEGIQCIADFPSPNAVLSALASKSGPDVILLDIQMGEACGLDAIRPIKALSRTTQVLMFTSCHDVNSKRRALTNGASGFLLKHFSIEKILSAIQQAIRNPAPHLKKSPRQNWVAPPRVEVGRQRKPLLWFKNCFDKIGLHRN